MALRSFMGCKSSPEGASYRGPLSFLSLWHHCLIFLLLKSLLSGIQLLPNPLNSKVSRSRVSAISLLQDFAAGAVREDGVFGVVG